MSDKLKNHYSAAKKATRNLVEYKTLQIFETKYKTLFTKKFENRKVYKAPEINKILARIPGTIVKVMVSEGDKVKKDQPLVILEAMKMKNKILIPVAGTIAALNVTEGERVSKNHLIAEIKQDN